MKFTTRQLLLFVIFTAVALAALSLGGVFASVVILLLSILSLAVAIIAFVGRDKGRAFATGYLITVVVYGAIHFASGSRELDPYAGRFLTTRLIRPLFQAMTSGKWIDSMTGREMPEGFDPNADLTAYTIVSGPGAMGGGGLGGGTGGFGGGGKSMVWYKEAVNRSTFMAVAHMLLAALLGCFGGKFAVRVHNHAQEASNT